MGIRFANKGNSSHGANNSFNYTLFFISVLENIQVEICKILMTGDDRPTQVMAYLPYHANC